MEILGHFGRFPALDVRQVATVSATAPVLVPRLVHRLIARRLLRVPTTALTLPEHPLFPFSYSITSAGVRALHDAATPR